MGWLMREKRIGETISLKNYVRSVCDPFMDVKGVSIVGSIAYIAVSIPKTNGIVCLVFMLRNTKTEIGYKDMDESMYPYYFDCPKKILDMLTPTECDNSNKWRKECRRRIPINKAYRKIGPGTVIDTVESISFGRKSEYGPYSQFT